MNVRQAIRCLEERHERAAVYAFAAKLFLRELDQSTWNWLRRHQESLPGLELGERDGRAQAPLDELAIDYCRIFVGPRDHVPPFQSVCQSGLLQSRAADSMKRYLQIVSVSDQAEAMVDHFGLQLQLMGTILDGSVEDGDLESLGELARSFFRDHLVWSNAMLNRARQRAATDFYRSLIDWTLQFIKVEREVFELD